MCLPFMRCRPKNERSTCIFMSLTHTDSFYTFIIVTFLLFTYVAFKTVDFRIYRPMLDEKKIKRLNPHASKLISTSRKNNKIDIEQEINNKIK